MTDLVSFLCNHPLARLGNRPTPFAKVHIIDSVDGILVSSHVFADTSLNVEELGPDFHAALSTRPPGAKTRIIVAEFRGQIYEVNTAFLDAIALRFRLNPFFLCLFVRLIREHTLGVDTHRAHNFLPKALPSEDDSLMISVELEGMARVASISHQDGLPTGMFLVVALQSAKSRGSLTRVLKVIVLSHTRYFIDEPPPPPPAPLMMASRENRPLDRQLLDANRFPREFVLAADQHPCDFLLPFITSSLRAASSASWAGALQYVSRTLSNPALAPLRRPLSVLGRRGAWETNQANLRGLLRSRNSIANYLKRNYPASSGQPQPMLATVLDDFDAVIAEYRENATQLQCALQNQTSKEAILEARKSLEQADAVRRYVLKHGKKIAD